MNKRYILLILSFLSIPTLLSACAAASNHKNILLGTPIIIKTGGIIVEVPTQTIEHVYYKEKGSFTACYIKLLNMTDKTIRLENNYFVIRDDKNNLYPSIPLTYMEKKYTDAFVPYLDFSRTSSGNFQLANDNIDEQINMYYQEDTPGNVRLHGLHIEEINPDKQIEGYIYFPEVTTFADKKVTLLISIPDSSSPLDIEFLIQ